MDNAGVPAAAVLRNTAFGLKNTYLLAPVRLGKGLGQAAATNPGANNADLVVYDHCFEFNLQIEANAGILRKSDKIPGLSMVKVLNRSQEDNLVKIEAEADLDAVNKGMDKAFRSLVQKANIPGFRKGKIPRKVFEQHYGRDMILSESVQYVVSAAYPDIIENEKLEPIDQPQDLDVKELKEGQPLVFTLSVQVRPEVKLGKYKGIKVKAKQGEVSDSDIQTQLEQLAEAYIDYKETEADHELSNGDLASYSVKAMIDGESYPAWSKERAGGRVGTSWIDPKFDDQILGMKKGEERNFTIEFDKDDEKEDVKGKSVSFFVVLQQIHTGALPEIDDELAKKTGRFESIDALKADMRQQLEDKSKKDFEQAQRQEVFEALIERCEIKVPELLITREVDRSKHELEHQLGHRGADIAAYAMAMQKTEDEVLADIRDASEKRVRLELILDAIAKKEDLKVEEADFDAEITRQAEQAQKDPKEIKKQFNQRLRDYMEPHLLKEKTIALLLGQN